MNLDTLELQIVDNAAAASKNLDSLAVSLSNLKSATAGGAGLSKVAKQLDGLSTSLSKITNIGSLSKLSTVLGSVANIPKGNLTTLSNGVSKLSGSLQELNSTSAPVAKLSELHSSLLQLSSVPKGNLTVLSNGLSNLTNAISALGNIAIPSAKLTELYVSIQQLSSVGKGNLAAMSNGILKATEAIQSLTTVSIPTEKISQLATSLQPLTAIGKSSFNTLVTGLSKIGDVSKTLESTDMGKFATQIQRVAAAIKPLADEAAKVYVGLKWLPGIVNKVIGANGNLSRSNINTAKSYKTLNSGIGMAAAKWGILFIAARRTATYVQGWIESSNRYVENLNLFSVSMGKYAQEALDYAKQINKSMGIDISEWIRNQGIIMDMSKSFGIAEDSAYKMSKALTQLSYDFASLYDIKVSESMLKIQSALAGEIEPVRRLGKDISVAKLQMVLLSLGIDRTVESLAQSDKAMLRTIALLQQSGSAMGDFARTLNSPANQMRVLNARIAEFSRAMGNLFMPMISAALPYLIAFVQVITEAVNALASLFGFELPKFDYSGLGEASGSIGQIGNSLEDAADSAKKLKGMLAGFDELNVIQQQDKGNGDVPDADLGGILGSELDNLIKLYDEKFANAIKQKSEEIAKSMKAYFEPLIPFFQGIGVVLGAAWDKLKEWHDQYFYPWLIDIGNWMKENPETLKKIGEWVAAIGVAFLGWKIISSVATPVIGIFKALATAFGAFKAGGAIGKLFVAGGLFTKTGAIATGFVKIFGTGGVIASVAAKIGAFLAPIGTAFAGLAAALGISVGALAAIVVGAVAAVAAIIIYWDEIKVFFTETIPAWWNGTVVPFFENMWNSLTENVSKAIDGVKMAWDKFINWLGELPKNIGRIVGMAATVFVEFFTYHIPNWITSAKEWFDQMVENIKLAFSNTIAAIKQWGVDTWAYLSVEVPRWILSVVTWFSELPGKLWNWLVETYNKIVQWGKDTLSWITAKVPRLVRQVVDFFMELPGELYRAGKNAIQSFWDGVMEKWNSFKRWWSDVWSDFKSGFGETFNPRVSVSYENSRSNINGYATGGFPASGEMFLARENGIPEMVGAIGNRTAVANNDQIVSGIVGGVSKANEPVVAAIHAMANAMVSAYVNNQPIVAIGEKEIARVSQAGVNRLNQLAVAP